VSIDARAADAPRGAADSALLPGVSVESADTAVVRNAPDADCVIGATGTPYSFALPLARAPARTRSILAAGELAWTLPHRVNIPIAALLAEARRLELKPSSPDQQASVCRIVELYRRLVGVSRSIEGTGTRGPSDRPASILLRGRGVKGL